jgi:hypothetical protein
MGDFFKIERKNCGKGNTPPSSKNYRGRMILQSAISNQNYKTDAIKFQGPLKEFQFS